MTLALIQPSSGRRRVQAAAEHLQAALNELRAAAAEEGAENARRAERLERDEAARVKMRKAQAALDGFAVRIDRRWLEEFGQSLEAVAKAIEKRGERSHVGELGRLLGGLRHKLDEASR
jgi:hypothetical protein